MSSQDSLILAEFQKESKNLLGQMMEILEACALGPGHALRLEEYGNLVDRIMGGAKSLEVGLSLQNPALKTVGAYAEVCKAVGYQTSQIENHPDFYDICIQLLLDATEVLEELIDRLSNLQASEANSLINQKILDRLRWVSGKFGEEARSIGGGGRKPKLNQKNIDDLLRKLGV